MSVPKQTDEIKKKIPIPEPEDWIFDRVLNQNKLAFSLKEGITKREYFAGLAMQGWISCQEPGYSGDADNVAEKAIEYADTLLRKLDR